MQIFIENAAGRQELPAGNIRRGLSLFHNALLVILSEKESVRIESNGYEKTAQGPGECDVPVIWDKTNCCSIRLTMDQSITKYEFQLEETVPPSDENIANLLKFAMQMEENFRPDQAYGLEELFEAVRTDKVALMIEKTPYTGYDDQSLMKKISETIPMVMDICSHPKQSLRTEEAVLDVNLVKRINSRTMDHLASHSEHWKARTLNGLIPGRLRADIFEDEIDIYENLFFRMAVDDILKYIHRQAVSIAGTIEQNDSAIDWNAYGEILYDYKRMRIFQQLLPDYNVSDRKEENQVLSGLLRQWEKLERHFSTAAASRFYRSIDKKKRISRNIRPTNILKKDSRYHGLYRLWCGIQRQVIQEQKESRGIGGEPVKASLSNYYAMYAAVILMYAFKLLEYKAAPTSQFSITKDGIIEIDAVFQGTNMSCRVSTAVNRYGNLDIFVSFVEKNGYVFRLPAEVLDFVDKIQENLPKQVKLDAAKNALVFYAKPDAAEQRNLKNLFHLSASAKKSMEEADIAAKESADKIWRPKLESLFASGRIKDARTETVRISPQYAMIENSERSVEKYTRKLLETTDDTAVYLLPVEIGTYRKHIKSEKILWRLLNYGEKYAEKEAALWGDYRTGIIPVAQSEINSAQRLMKFISTHAARLQIKWNDGKPVCPVCGSLHCTEEGANNWKCKNPDCNILFGKTRHAEGCGAGFEWTRPSVDIGRMNLDFQDPWKLMLKKESIFDRLAITDFEFEKRDDGSVKYIPVCPKCGRRAVQADIQNDI